MLEDCQYDDCIRRYKCVTLAPGQVSFNCPMQNRTIDMVKTYRWYLKEYRDLRNAAIYYEANGDTERFVATNKEIARIKLILKTGRARSKAKVQTSYCPPQVPENSPTNPCKRLPCRHRTDGVCPDSRFPPPDCPLPPPGVPLPQIGNCAMCHACPRVYGYRGRHVCDRNCLPKRIIERTCHCGREFQVILPFQRCCSDYCAAVAALKRWTPDQLSKREAAARQRNTELESLIGE